MFRLFEFGVLIGLFLLTSLLAGATGGVAGDDAGGAAGGIGVLLIVVVALGLFIPGLAVTARRLHDTDRSGWMMFISLIPLIGGIILLVFLFSEGTRGPNRYGEDPKAGSAGSDVFA